MKDNDSEANDKIQKNVQEILEHLVAHFGQNIHAEVIINSYSKNATSVPLLSSTTNGPKKEQLELQERTTPPIVQLWLDRLLSLGLPSHGPCSVANLLTKGDDCDGSTRCRDNESIVTLLCEWIDGYKKVVRPRLFKATSTVPTFDERSVPILKNYELVLSKLLLKSIDMEEDEQSSVSILVSPVPPFHLERKLLHAINILSTDVTLLTAGASGIGNKKDERNHFRRNEGLPNLMQILGNTLETLRQKISNASSKSGNDQTTNQFKKFVPECLESLRQCAVTILAFDLLDESISDSSLTQSSQSALSILLPHSLSPSLSTSGIRRKNDLTLLRRILKRTEISTDDHLPDSSSIVRKYLERVLGADSLSYDDIDDDYWNSLLSTSPDSLSVVGWIDSNPNNARGTLRIVHGIWRSMESLLLNLSKEGDQMHNRGDSLLIEVMDTKEHRERRAYVLKELGGPDPLLRSARAHFFGRNLHGMEDLAHQKSKLNDNEVDDIGISSVVIKMGRRVTKTKHNTNADGNGPIHERVPSRTVAALNALRLLLVSELMDDINDACREIVLENIFPICAALLDSNNAVFGAFGAAGFLRAIDALAPRGLDLASINSLPHQRATGQLSNIFDSEGWINFAENTLAVLDRSLQSNRDHGHVIVAIGRVQSRLFEIVLSEERRKKNENQKQMAKDDTEKRFRRRRKSVTEQWLSKLERSLYRPVTERQQLELLLGGVIPLLSQHAIDESFEADGIELGRLGLSALLPLTSDITRRVDITKSGVESVGEKTQMASMVALINLMFAAHPIMASHGGKLMSHLLMAAASPTTLSRYESDSDNKDGSLQENDSTMGDSVRNMAVLVAAMGLVVCGSKLAGQVLYSIESDREQYQQNLLTTVSEVRKLSVGLMAINRSK